VTDSDVAACGIVVGFALSADSNLLVALRLLSWMCSKRVASSVKSPNGVTVCWETLERWYDWQAHAQLQQSDCTPGHTKHSATIFTVAFEPGGDRSRLNWNTWSRRGPGTYGRGLLVEVLQYIDTVVLGSGSFSSHRVVADPRSVWNSLSLSAVAQFEAERQPSIGVDGSSVSCA
jgi:hypothetical protein